MTLGNLFIVLYLSCTSKIVAYTNLPKHHRPYSSGGYTALHARSNRRVQKRCGSGVKKGKSRSVNGRNGFPKAVKESGPIC